jgi:type III pantothenate kinase
MPESTSPPRPGWLVLDIGNSATKGAVMVGERIIHTFQIATAPPDAWQAALQSACEEAPAFERVGMASVVPPLAARARESVRAWAPAAPLVVRPTLTMPLSLHYETPETLGTDRLALAVGAWTRYGTSPPALRDVIAIDAGTALTYEVITADGTYLGGAIAPGPRLLAEALHRGTAQLPDVPLTLPDGPIGRSTTSALQSGILFGFLDGVQGMLNRLQCTLDTDPIIVVTGGWAAFLRKHLHAIHDADPHLVLRGIQALMTQNP